MSEIVLNRGQQKIYDAAIKWYRNSSSELFQIASEAGCGKSVLIGEIVKGLGLKQEEILPMSYTGQASLIMKLHGMANACTCHSALFTPVQEIRRDIDGRPLIDPQFNTPIMTWKFIPKDFRNSGIKLIIVDEAWMVPKSFRKHIDNTGIKVIATGDQGQLPPIHDQPGYLADGEIHYLTEIMRQSENSPLVYIAHRARHGLPIEYGMYGNDVLVIADDELDNNIIANSSVILCGKNNTRESLNRRMRKDILHIDHDFPSMGERLICRKNNWLINIGGIPLVNGLIGSVLFPPDIGSYDGKTMKIAFLPDLSPKPFYDLSINYDFLNAKFEDKDKIRNSPYTRGDLFEYAYASTVHLAQGSEYFSGTYIEEYMGGGIQNALNYTAITRFREKMIYVKTKPKFWNI